ncbi:uncharacterized protein [Henckelia pumila]|uniref:uncharacterized protein n=1 Tax=Henckelia pumila TaxID=405737 RepID=UPI003C6E0339
MRTHKPDVIFLIETLVHVNKLEEIRSKLGFDFVFGVDRIGPSGGLGVFWKANINCSITNFSRNHIDMEIEDVHKGKWRLTGIYGFPERDRRRASWDFLRTLHARSSLPWACIGDFNDLLSNEEKRGRLAHPTWCIRGFQEVVTECGLNDLHMEGYPFTWVKSKGTADMIEERLDRDLVSQTWLDIFPEAKLENLIAPISDHTPLCLSTETQVSHYHQKVFRFENKWLEEPDLKDLMMQTWNASITQDVSIKLTYCTEVLSRWSKNKTPNFWKEINAYHVKIESLRLRNDPNSIEQYEKTKNQLVNLLMQEEIYWKQRAKCYWLKDGDSNTRFFHSQASARRNKNRIERLHEESGMYTEDENRIGEIIQEYFVKLFSHNSGDYAPVLETVSTRLTTADNDMLLAPFTMEEFKSAIF